MEFVLNFTIVYGIFPLLFFLFKKNQNRNIKEIFPFLVIVFIASLYELIGSVILNISYENWYLIYKTLAFFSLHYFFFKLLNKKFKLIFTFYLLVFILLIILTNTTWVNSNFLDINAYFNMLQMFVVLNFSLFWLKRLFVELEQDDLLKNPNFYFISGLIIYYCGTAFLFLMSSSIYAQDKSSLQFYWLINIFLNFVLRSLLIFGVWKARVK